MRVSEEKYSPEIEQPRARFADGASASERERGRKKEPDANEAKISIRGQRK